MEIEDTPASRIIGKFKSVANLAAALGVEPQVVYRWTYSKDKRGGGGVIPQGQHQKIYDAGKRVGIDITSNDFSVLVEA